MLFHGHKISYKKDEWDLHEYSLSGNDKVRLAIFVDESGIRLHPNPASLFGKQPKYSQPTLTCLYHCRGEEKGDCTYH